MRTERKRLRKSVSRTSILKQFIVLVLETSSVHGFSHISARKRHPVENFIWILFVLIGAYSAYYFAQSTLKRYHSSPTVISLERNHQEWNTTFPANTICASKKIDEGVPEHVIRKWFGDSVNTSEALEWLNALFSANYDNFDQLEIEDRLPANRYLEVLVDTAFKFEYIVETFAGEVNMTRYMTERGLCYAFNSAVAVYSTPESWISNNAGGSADPSVNDKLLKKSPFEGYMHSVTSDMNSAYVVYVHSPFEVPDISRSPLKGLTGHYLNFDVTVSSTVSTEGVRDLAVSQRKCRFWDEPDYLETSPVYSYNHCKSECRMRLAHKLCGCVPYFYRPHDPHWSLRTEMGIYCHECLDMPFSVYECDFIHYECVKQLVFAEWYTTCNVRGMKCLGLNKARLITLKDEKCECLPSCEEDRTSTHNLGNTKWPGANNMKIDFLRYPRSRLKRDLFFTRSDLLVQLGGSVSLCLGCSVLSLCEFLYLFSLRLILFILHKKTRSRI